MDIQKFGNKKTGKLVEVTGVPGITHAFVPDPLPPDWKWPERLWPLLLEAQKVLARLDGIGLYLPNPQLLLRPLQNREAQRSSSLEGTYTDPQEQLLFQINPEYPKSDSDPINSYREVFNYEQALRSYSKDPGYLPISLRLVRNLHNILLDGVRGADSQPGEFRVFQNQIGRPARFVPPPPNYLLDCLDKLEKYLYKESVYDPLVNAFMVHYQFEAIHPFQDGNGRVGRLLLAILIQEWCNLSNQWLYMSAYFDSNKDEYIDRLFRISTDGEWEGWIEFCLTGVVIQSEDTMQRCEKLIALLQSFRERIQKLSGRNARLIDIAENLFVTPVIEITYIADEYHVTYPTAKSDIEKLASAGILKEITAAKQKTYYSPEIFEITYKDSLGDNLIDGTLSH
jgi:Fic family protein